MNLKNTVLIGLCLAITFLAITTAFASGQKKGFSGSWIFDEKNSNLRENTMGPIAAGSTSGIPDITEINCSARKLTIFLKTTDSQEQKLVEKQSFLLDGRQRIIDKNSVVTVRAKTYKKGKKIIIETERYMTLSKTIYINDEFEVSNNGDVLTINRKERTEVITITFNIPGQKTKALKGASSEVDNNKETPEVKTETLVFRRQ